MAELIVHFSEEMLQTGKDDIGKFDVDSLRSKDIIRVWPTTYWKAVDVGTGAKGHTVEVKLKGRTDKVLVRSKRRKWDDDLYNWIVLPTGPGRVIWPDGIPSHMWTGFHLDDGK